MRRIIKRSPTTHTEEIEATVSSVLRDYAVTYPKDASLLPEGENITFSLSHWQDDPKPVKGQVVLLSGIVRFSKGWRASSARPMTLPPRQKTKERRQKDHES